MIPMLRKYSYCRKKQCALFLVLTRGLTANHFLVHFVFFLLVMYTCIILDFLCKNTIMDYCLIYSTCSNKTRLFTSTIHANQTYCMFQVVEMNWENVFLGTKLSLFGMKFIKMFVLISKLVHLSDTWNLIYLTTQCRLKVMFIITGAAHGLALKKCQSVGCTRDICIDDSVWLLYWNSSYIQKIYHTAISLYFCCG